jgi:membrane associated rhomboid family serine protease
LVPVIQGEFVTRAREPIFNLPAVVLAVAALLTLIHAARTLLLNDEGYGLIIDFAFIPAREISWLVPGIIRSIVEHGPAGAGEGDIDLYRLALELSSEGGAHPWTVLTYALLHEGWLHLLLNIVVLAALGTPVARRFGPARFLALISVGAAAGALMHLLLHSHSVAPLIGASAAVTAAMGAAARFVFDPEAREGASAPSLAASLRNRSVMVFTLAWFFANAMSGLGANPSALANASIAWEAHIGGFLLGFLAFALFDRKAGDVDGPRSDAAEPE